MSKDRLLPNGFCWCGCSKRTGLGRFFAQGHDKIAEATYMAVHHEASVARLLSDAGFAPGDRETIRQAALDRGGWELCPRGLRVRRGPDQHRQPRQPTRQGKLIMNGNYDDGATYGPDPDAQSQQDVPSDPMTEGNSMSNHIPPVGGEQHEYFPLEDDCVGSNGEVYPEHNYPPAGEGDECRRCGTEVGED
ncbi:hypothetical protein [Streptomyces sp. NPDC059783]|uniref:hypothetical protein n=1 Tax=Streptomyces sp. NPDC059783 TaxID=3346944 RepID=UPI00365FCC6B